MQQRGRLVGALVRTLVAADLYRALEVHLHRVRELEGLEVGVREHRGARPEVLDLGEARHQLRSGDAAALVDCNGRYRNFDYFNLMDNNPRQIATPFYFSKLS